ncbi:hypothetical protein CR152_27795 [Massilia violaceinigra]|uniref:Uncharacterized protein n=1 Tax=Massilia violaceinigra TaxID=2045208 RepID=A0A2D2DSC7_9BURK|nr:hypothetical protein [Massilia violaceinigra]ATQ77881.1 hypothetical protein CR152_27795 [Massilia violaceinigra]
MRLATNHLGYVVQRFDGPAIGWFATTDPTTPEKAKQQLDNLARTPGAEYRVYPALGEKA